MNDWSMEEARERIKHPIRIANYEEIANTLSEMGTDNRRLLELVDCLQAVIEMQTDTINGLQAHNEIDAQKRKADQARIKVLEKAMNEVKELALLCANWKGDTYDQILDILDGVEGFKTKEE